MLADHLLASMVVACSGVPRAMVDVPLRHVPAMVPMERTAALYCEVVTKRRNSISAETPFVYQQKEERGEFLVKLFYDKELDLCNWGPNPKFAPFIDHCKYLGVFVGPRLKL